MSIGNSYTVGTCSKRGSSSSGLSVAPCIGISRSTATACGSSRTIITAAAAYIGTACYGSSKNSRLCNGSSSSYGTTIGIGNSNSIGTCREACSTGSSLSIAPVIGIRRSASAGGNCCRTIITCITAYISCYCSRYGKSGRLGYSSRSR